MAAASDLPNTNAPTGISIFDEIQQNFLKVLKNNKNPTTDSGSHSFDSTLTAGTDFFLPPTPADEVDPQLFAVEQGELRPISSPFMVPGIYKKVDTYANKVPANKSKANNVFFTETEVHGRIVRNVDFQKLYVCDNERQQNVAKDVSPKEIESACPLPIIIKAQEAKSPKKYDALSKLAYNILKLSNCNHSVIINRNLNEIVRTDRDTNQKTIYRFIDDEALGVQPSDEINEEPQPEKPATVAKKLGRPRKRRLEDGVQALQSQVSKKESNQCKTKCSNQKPVPENRPVVCSRFGRVLKKVKTESVQQKTAHDTTENSFENTLNLIADLKDQDYKCNLKEEKPRTDANERIENEKPTVDDSPQTKRYVPPESICPTCKKVFLGRRLKRHFVQHPDHMKPPTPPPLVNGTQNLPQEELSLFRFLVSKLQKSNLNEDQRADLFLHEINDLVEQIQLRSSRLIHNTSGLHCVSARTARVLGIPEGQYALDMSALDAPPEPETNYEINALTVPSANTRSLDYTALSLDDTLTDEAAQKLNLSAGGKILPPSEESLLRAVDDLVPPANISKLVPPNLLNRSAAVPHYDHVSDNAVEAVTMKDFFQFKTN